MSTFVKIIRWIARILGILFILLILTFTLSQELRSFTELSVYELVMSIALLGIIVGMITAWKWESASSMVILIGFAIFWIINIVTSGQFKLGPIFPLVPLVGFLHLYCASRQKTIRRT